MMDVDEFELERETSAPIDMLEHYFTAHGWSCERGDDEIVANFQGSWTQYELRAIWREEDHVLQFLALPDVRVAEDKRAAIYERSEEHTSELQSRQYLVCRLLLEKKNTKNRLLNRHTSIKL